MRRGRISRLTANGGDIVVGKLRAWRFTAADVGAEFSDLAAGDEVEFEVADAGADRVTQIVKAKR